MKGKDSCEYCSKRFYIEEMTPLFELNKERVSLYCDRCLPEVKSNIKKLPWNHLYTWGSKTQ